MPPMPSPQQQTADSLRSIGNILAFHQNDLNNLFGASGVICEELSKIRKGINQLGRLYSKLDINQSQANSPKTPWEEL
jgi:hypothetical protein